MNFQEALATLGLDANQSEELVRWIGERALLTRIDQEEIKTMFTTRVKEAVEQGLGKVLGKAEFIEYVKSTVISDASNVIPPAPGKEIVFMPIGMYPRRMRKFGNKEDVQCEIVGWGKMGEGQAEITSMMVYGSETIQKLNTLKPYTAYNTVIGIDLKKKQMGFIRGSVHKDTLFGENVATPDWLPATVQERQAMVVTRLATMNPIVALGTANSHLSRLKTTEKSPGVRGKPFVDNLDFKVIQVTINDVTNGRQKSGLEWGSLKVGDSSFVPTHDHKGFNVWCDIGLIRTVGAGIGSYVRIIGSLAFDKSQKYPEMTACSIVPITLVPYKEQAPNLSGNAQNIVESGSAQDMQNIRSLSI